MAKAKSTDTVADGAADHCEDSLNMVEGARDDPFEDVLEEVLDRVRECGQ